MLLTDYGNRNRPGSQCDHGKQRRVCLPGPAATTYTVSAEGAGFRVCRQTDIDPMEVGAVTETVTVAGHAEVA